jgi:membrane associated rhomboid family serine protease
MRYYNYGGGQQYHRPSFFGGGFRFFPPVIKTLLITNAVVFFMMFLLGSFRIGNVPLYNVFVYYLGLMPIGNGFLPWQLVTYLFLHGGLLHLFFNMFALWMFGMELENQWGSKKFLWFYLICGIGAGLTNLFIAPIFTTVGPTVGASGSVYGVLLAFAMMYPDRPIFLYFLFPIKAKYFITFFILLELMNGVTGTQSGVAHFAHLGGAFVAFLYLMADWDRIPVRRWFAGFQTKQKSDRLRYHRGGMDIEDAKYYDIRDEKKKDSRGKEIEIDQQRIDEILDKISKSGYQNLTAEEKQILFEASQKLK